MFCVFITAQCLAKKNSKSYVNSLLKLLQHVGVASEQVQTEWVMLKSHLYNKWV